jgi:hypothetical protein
MTKSLWINDSGASTAAIQAGIDAAINHFNQAGCSAEDAHDMAFNENSSLRDPFQAPDMPYNEIWDVAEYKALEIVFKGWIDWPEAAILVLE